MELSAYPQLGFKFTVTGETFFPISNSGVSFPCSPYSRPLSVMAYLQHFLQISKNEPESVPCCLYNIYIITYSIQNTYIYTYRLCIYVYMYTTQRAVVPASFVDFTFVSEVQAKKVDDEELGFVGEVTGAPPLGGCWLGKWCVNSA